MANLVVNRVAFDCTEDEFKGLIEQYCSYSEYEGSEDTATPNLDLDFKKVISPPNDKYDYQWVVENWGTSKNAFDTSIDYQHRTITFDTVWNAPYPVIDKLGELIPFAFSHEWAEEGMGNDVGKVEYSNGERKEYEYEDYSDEAVKLAIHLWGDEEECFQRNEDGRLQRYDCEECPNPCENKMA